MPGEETRKCGGKRLGIRLASRCSCEPEGDLTEHYQIRVRSEGFVAFNKAVILAEKRPACEDQNAVRRTDDHVQELTAHPYCLPGAGQGTVLRVRFCNVN